jgi:predicted nucleic acid-binding protein
MIKIVKSVELCPDFLYYIIMKESIYLETTIISYYTARPSRDIIMLARQEITREWWPKAIEQFDIFISEGVIDEISLGDIEAAEKRLNSVKKFARLELNEQVKEIAKIYMKNLEIPAKSFGDAIHLAFASVHNIDYLVTWNCTHIANPVMIKKLIKINNSIGINTPFICTPDLLMKE